MRSRVVVTPAAGTALVRWPQRLGSSASEAAAAIQAAAAAAVRVSVSGLGSGPGEEVRQRPTTGQPLDRAPNVVRDGRERLNRFAPEVAAPDMGVETAIAALVLASKQIPPNVP